MHDGMNLHAVLAEFEDAERLVAAAEVIRAQGFRGLDAFTPFPVEGLSKALGIGGSAVPRAMLIGGLAGAAAGFLMQVGTNLAYPLWVGGRPLLAVPAFLLVTFESTVLFAVLACIGTMLVANRLPKLHHPIFSVRGFDLSADDKFYLAIRAGEDFDRDAAGKALTALKPRAIIDVPESPE
jgi:hypothetical protein